MTPTKTSLRVEVTEGVVLCYFGVDDEETLAAMIAPSMLGYRVTDDKHNVVCDGPREAVVKAVSEYLGSIHQFTAEEVLLRALTLA